MSALVFAHSHSCNKSIKLCRRRLRFYGCGAILAVKRSKVDFPIKWNTPLDEELGAFAMRTVKKEYLLTSGILVLLFGFYVVWAVTQPYNSAPDEYMRYQIPEFIYQHGALPHGGDPSIRNPIWGISYGFTPILSYIISAGFMKVTSLFTTDPFALLMLSLIHI